MNKGKGKGVEEGLKGMGRKGRLGEGKERKGRGGSGVCPLPPSPGYTTAKGHVNGCSSYCFMYSKKCFYIDIPIPIIGDNKLKIGHILDNLLIIFVYIPNSKVQRYSKSKTV